jgi:hypothetical protein
MYKFYKGAAAALLAVSMVGCAQKKEAEEPTAPTTEPTAEVEATPDAQGTETENKFVPQGAWEVYNKEATVEGTTDVQKIADSSADEKLELVDVLGERKGEHGTEHVYLVYRTDSEGLRTWAVTYLDEDADGVTQQMATYPIDLSEYEYVSPANKNLGEHKELEAGWDVFSNKREASFSVEEFATIAKESFEKNNVKYEAEVFLGEAITGNGFIVLARDLNDDGTTKDFHIVEIARSGEFDENGPVDEFDMTVDNLLDFAKYTLNIAPADNAVAEQTDTTSTTTETN